MSQCFSIVDDDLNFGIPCLFLKTSMPPRKRSAMRAPDLEAHDPELFSKLVGCGTKTGLVDAIAALGKAGWLKSNMCNVNARLLRRRLQDAVKHHHDKCTPYGPVVQSMALPINALHRWEFAHPCAFLSYLSTLCPAFSEIMHSVVKPGVPCGLIIYIDEIQPGDPLRPEKARTLQAIYWALANWRQWLLQRTGAWPRFGAIRSKLVLQLDDGVASLMMRISNVFFAESGPSFAKGVQIVRSCSSLLITARFLGFLADDRAHTELTNSNGVAGKCYFLALLLPTDCRMCMRKKKQNRDA